MTLDTITKTETNAASRRVTTTVTIYGDEDTRQLTVSSSHDRERKQLRTSISRATVEQHATHTVVRTTLYDPPPDGIRSYVATPIPRYTLTALAAWHATVMAGLDLDTLTQWASEAGSQ